MILTESGFAQAIVKEMRTTGYEHPYWQEWKNRTGIEKIDSFFTDLLQRKWKQTIAALLFIVKRILRLL